MTEVEEVPIEEPIEAPAVPAKATEAVEPVSLEGVVLEGAVSAPAFVDPFFGYLADNAEIHTGTWAGLQNYECSMCGFASLDRAAADAHVSIHGQTFTQGARP